MKRDYYEVLGVDKTADDRKLKSAYRKLAKKYHPDANPGNHDAELKFKEVGEAYAVLSDPEKRKLYDAYGFAAFEAGGPSPQGQGGGSAYRYAGGDGSGFQSFHFDGQDAEDLFESVFGDLFGRKTGGRRKRTAYSQNLFHDGTGFARGGGYGDGMRFSSFGDYGAPEQLDLRTSLTIDFREAALGCRKTIRLAAPDGSGTQTLEIAIPAGIDEGKSVRLRGKGQASSSGKTGDLLIEIHIAPDSQYTRKGLDIYTSVFIPYSTAALGGEALVPTLHGNVSCRIPAGMQSGKQLRLKGKGIKGAGSKVGDEYAEIRIDVPKSLTAEERRLIKKLAELGR